MFVYVEDICFLFIIYKLWFYIFLCRLFGDKSIQNLGRIPQIYFRCGEYDGGSIIG